MIFFLGSVLFIVIWVLTRKFSLLGRVSLVVILFIVVGLTEWSSDWLLRADLSWYETSPYKEGVALFFMIAGMAGKYVFDVIEKRRKRKAEGHNVADIEFDQWDFFQPYIVAFAVFGLFWKSYGYEALDVGWLVISFQNGFFWQTILGKSV